MYRDAFLKFHPVVNLMYFVGVISFTVFLYHPMYLMTGVLVGATYYLLLNGKKGIKIIVTMMPLFVFIALLNPILNSEGNTVLFYIWGRPYTLEALVYGVVVAAIFIVTMLWIGCYNKVLTGDRVMSIFASRIPAITMILVMIFRMIPHLLQKIKQIVGARQGIGKGIEKEADWKVKFGAGMTVLSVITSMALEESIVTSDSMRARGYGTTRRSSFLIYLMKNEDRILLALMGILSLIVIGFAVNGSMKAEFLPERNIIPIKGVHLIGYIAYLVYLLIPILLNIKELVRWKISRYKI